MKYHQLNSKNPDKRNKQPTGGVTSDEEDDDEPKKEEQTNKITLEDALDFNQRISGKKQEINYEYKKEKKPTRAYAGKS